MGPVLPHQRKSRLPQYSRDKIKILQEKCNKPEALGVLKKPEDLNITVKYVNPSFLLKEVSRGYRLVSEFEYVGRYRNPQLLHMSDVELILMFIGQWKALIIISYMMSAFHQMSLLQLFLE